MTLQQIERDWFANHLADSEPNQSLTDLKRRYIFSVVNDCPQNESTEGLVKRWLRKIITDQSATPSGEFINDLLKQTLIALGLTVSMYPNENWRQLFINLP